jgi:hypothetical protein
MRELFEKSETSNLDENVKLFTGPRLPARQ